MRRLCNACPGQPVLVPSLLKHSERVLGFWYESRNPGRICVARLPAYARSVVKCPPPSGTETETRCRTTAFIQPCDVNAPHPLQHYCSSGPDFCPACFLPIFLTLIYLSPFTFILMAFITWGLTFPNLTTSPSLLGNRTKIQHAHCSSAQ